MTVIVVMAFGISLSGCQFADSSASKSPPKPSRAAPSRDETESAEVRILEDEAMLRGSQAIIGGAVQNTSAKKLEALKVELELTRRRDDSSEIRVVELKPQNLAPGEQGRYAVTLASHEWAAARVARLLDANNVAISFKSEPGAKRPLERIGNGKIVGEPAPRPKTRGSDEFINTPDNPSKIP
ncbi:MAG: hypothetical protein M3458_04570 [Acidobacteriota bacterium]|nr:hypothetical protein [Acidobacteriota bacterium]